MIYWSTCLAYCLRMKSKVAGVVGLGSAGQRHARLLIEDGFTVVAVRSRLGPTVYRSPADILEVSSIEALASHNPSLCVIASPTHLHLQQALELTAHGIPVLIEKPLIGKADELLMLDQQAKALQIPLVMGYHLRFHPGLQEIAELLREKALGLPLISRISWGEYLPHWHPGEDFTRSYAALNDQAGGPASTLSHTIDYSVRLFGNGLDFHGLNWSSGQLGIEAPEVALASITHSSNCVSSHSLDFLTQPAEHRLQISLTEGSMSLDFLHSILVVTDAKNQVIHRSSYGDVANLRIGCFRAQIQQFESECRGSRGGLSSHDLHVATLVSALHYSKPHSFPHS